jgi:tetratricopeptide (TPR) repeat protein|nr:serine/threonine-protein kinase [Kofleriaceae bacterium]
MASCPDANAIHGFVSGRVDDSERARIQAHVDTCDKCRLLIGGLATPMAAGVATVSDVEHSIASMPSQLARYRVTGRLGEGGMGVVYRGHDPELRRDVALKLLRSSRDGDSDTTGARARLAREAQAMARVSHPNVVTVFEAGVWEGQVFVAMELATGGTLRTWQQRRPRRDVLDAYAGAGRGLAAAHAAGLVHRDFKPDNVLVGADGRARVTDFGLARRAGTTETSAAASGMIGALTVTGTVMGTPAYMAPEQLDGVAADARSDQFSFCVSLWEALHGERPFVADTVVALRDAIRDGVTARGRVDRALARGLREQREDRWPSMDALLAALAPPRRLWIAGAAGAAIIAGLAVVAVTSHRAVADPCAQASDPIDAAWSPAVHDQVRAAFQANNRLDQLAGIVTDVDDYAAQWRAASIDTCRGAQLAGADARAYALRTRCLDSRIPFVEAVANELVHGSRFLGNVTAGNVLPPIEACADDAALLADKLPPPDPALETRLAAAAVRLENIDERAVAGELEGAIVDGSALIADLRTIGYPPAIAGALVANGRLLYYAGRHAEARADAEEAMRIAETAGDEADKADAVSLLVDALDMLHEPTTAWRGIAIASSKRRDASSQARARGLEWEAEDLARAGKLDEARRDWDQALALRAHTRDPLLPVQNRVSMALALRRAGGHADEVRAIVKEQAAYVESHITGMQRVVAMTDLASVLSDADLAEADHGEALDALLERALALAGELTDSKLLIAVLHRERALVRGMRGATDAHDELAAAMAGESGSSLAAMYLLLGDWERRGEHYDTALADDKRALALAPAGMDVSPLELLIGSLEVTTGDPRAAIARLEHVRGRSSHDDLQDVRATSALGRAYAAIGDARAVALLEEAIPKLDAHPGVLDPRRLADSKLALAKLLAARDPKRARDLAEQARGVYADKHATRELADADAFLRDHAR